MQEKQYRNYPKGYSDGDRLTYTPIFGDTLNNFSIKFLFLQNPKHQIFRIPYMNSKETFGSILIKYKTQLNYIKSDNRDLVVTLKKNGEVIDVGQTLQFYKEQIQDSSVCYFQVVQKTFKKNQGDSKDKNKEKIKKILEEKDYNFERLYDEEEMFLIKIKKADDSTFQVNAHRAQTIIQLKCDICNKLNLDIEQFILVYAGRTLDNDQQTLQFFEIDSSNIEVMMIMKSKSGCVRETSFIQISQKESKNIKELAKGDQIFSYNQEKKSFEIDYIESIHKTEVDQYTKIVFQSKQIIECSPTHRFYTMNQQWKDYSYDFNNPTGRLQAGDKILTSHNKYQTISKIHTIALQDPQTFYHLSVKNNHTFIINGFICHNMQIRIVNNQNGVQFLIDTNQYDTIADIKRKIGKFHNHPVSQQVILLDSRQLKNGESLNDFKVDFKNTTLRLIIRYDKELVIHRLSQKKQYKIDINRAETVKQVKEIIQHELQIEMKHQILFVGNVYLQDDMKLQKYQIRQNYNRINLFELQNGQITKSNVPRFNTKLLMKIKIKDNDEIKVSYDSFKEMHIKDFISSYIPNSRASYSFLFAEVLMHPSQKIIYLQKIEEVKDSSNYPNTFLLECQVVRNYDRLSFIKKVVLETPPQLKKNLIKNIPEIQEKQINEKSLGLIKVIKSHINEAKMKQFNVKIQDIYYAIQYFICGRPYEELLLFLKRFKVEKEEEIIYLEGYNHCSVLARSLLCLPNYYGTVHKVMENLRISQYYKKGEIFYWQGFLSTSNKVQNVIPLIKKRKSTLFHIDSINGRNISVFNYKNLDEVVFLPYSYFYIDQIKATTDYDEVWLTEMSTPLSFNKNIIIWVDDNPINNIQLVREFQSQKMQVVQLTSTKIAELWMKQFGWYLKWKNIKCRVVSDMVRIQKLTNIADYQAGINLIQNFQVAHGYTDPILIYCQDVSKAQQNVLRRNLPANRKFSISNSITDVRKFCLENN